MRIIKLKRGGSETKVKQITQFSRNPEQKRRSQTKEVKFIWNTKETKEPIKKRWSWFFFFDNFCYSIFPFLPRQTLQALPFFVKHFPQVMMSFVFSNFYSFLPICVAVVLCVGSLLLKISNNLINRCSTLAFTYILICFRAR